MSDSSILRVVTKLLLPYILLFALYVQFHGDYGPGGGFQAGVIFASGIVLYMLVYGLSAAKRLAPPRALEILMATGLLLYLGTGWAGLALGASFLDYGVLGPDAHVGQHRGLFLIELGVGITVASTMVTIVFAFAGRREERA